MVGSSVSLLYLYTFIQGQCEQVKQIQLVSADHDQRANPSRTASQAN